MRLGAGFVLCIWGVPGRVLPALNERRVIKLLAAKQVRDEKKNHQS